MASCKKTVSTSPDKYPAASSDLTAELQEDDIQQEMFKDMPPNQALCDDPAPTANHTNTEQDISDEISRELQQEEAPLDQPEAELN